MVLDEFHHLLTVFFNVILACGFFSGTYGILKHVVWHIWGPFDSSVPECPEVFVFRAFGGLCHFNCAI
jgi:hypothetical protein